MKISESMVAWTPSFEMIFPEVRKKKVKKKIPGFIAKACICRGKAKLEHNFPENCQAQITQDCVF